MRCTIICRHTEAGKLRPGRADLLVLITLFVMSGGCGSTPSGSTVIKTLHEIDDATPFGNVLVIGVAGDYPTRVRFEQDLVKALSGDEVKVTAYYTVVGRVTQLSRKTLNHVIGVRDFDAIILTRMKGQDRADLVPGRPTGYRFDLFLYDYDELNIPAPIGTESTVSFVVEVYDAKAKKKVWGIESLLFDADSVDSAVSGQVAAIASEILKDGLLRR